MKVVLLEKFINSLSNLSENETENFLKIYDKLTFANSISELDSRPLVGMPYLHTIEFGKYVIGIQVKNNEVELAGIVEKGKELSIFI
ncbi:MAG: hypothetical protein EAZ06_00480 [Cytophagales bacterium]|nr:MAG: hypothetical protein EAZ06_00480 [Cytophagales bacterium]